MKVIDLLKIQTLWFRFLRYILDFWLPSGFCVLCSHDSHSMVSQYGICLACFNRLKSEKKNIFINTCLSCLPKMLIAYSEVNFYKDCNCQSNKIIFHSLFEYSRSFKDILYKLKFEQCFELKRGIGLLLSRNHFLRESLKMGFILVPIPSTTAHDKGYGVMSLIVHELETLYGIVHKKLLYSRVKIPQKTLTRKDRFTNVKNNIIWKGKSYDKILLIDDIMTTGATMSEVIKILVMQGVREIRVLVLGIASPTIRIT